MNKAYKFRMYPNWEQRTTLAKTFGCVRFIYNQMLSDKTKQKLDNTPAQYKSEFEWLKEVDSLALICRRHTTTFSEIQKLDFRNSSPGNPTAGATQRTVSTGTL